MQPRNDLLAKLPKEERSELSALYRVERFWSYVRTLPDPRECWAWTGTMDTKGYGIFTADGRNHGAHRVAYELAYGAAPEPGLHLDHVCHTIDAECKGGTACRHRSCVRPSHLEPVTPDENVHRAIRQIAEAARRRLDGRAHCRHGHPWTTENIMVRKTGGRRCRVCHREQVKAAHQKSLQQ